MAYLEGAANQGTWWAQGPLFLGDLGMHPQKILNFKGPLRCFLVHFGAVVEHSVCYINNYFNIQIDLKIILILLSMFKMYTNKPSYIATKLVKLYSYIKTA